MNLGLPTGASQLARRLTRLDFIEGLGISIGQRHVAMAHLGKRLATVSLLHHQVVPLPSLQDADARRQALTAAVAGFLSSNDLNAERAFVVLPRGISLLAHLALPAAAKNDVRQVVEFEIDRLLPLAKEDVYFDFLVRNLGGSDRLDVLVVAARRSAVGEALGALEAAGVRARSVSIAPVALLDLVHFTSGGGADSSLFLVDDGGVIELDFYVRGELRSSHLVRADEVSSAGAVERLTADEATQATVSPSDVRLYAWATTSGADSAEPSALSADVLATGSEMLRRLDSSLKLPEGFASTATPTLLPAIGAGLAAVREGEADLNLLPLEERRAVEDGAPVLTFFCAAVLVAVTVVWLVSAMIQDYRISSKLHAELEALEPQIRQVHQNEEEAKSVRERLSVLTQGDKRRITGLLKELSDAIPESAYISTFRLRNDRVELEGFARSASDLVPLLEKSRHFRGAQFTSPVTKVQNNQERFSLTTEIEE